MYGVLHQVTIMDKFDKTMKMMKDMGQNEKMMKMQMYMDMCSCPKCPSYMDCSKMDSDAMFCLKGPSMMCSEPMNACNCKTCMVEKDLMMKDQMYCMNGSEFENRYMQKMT